MSREIGRAPTPQEIAESIGVTAEQVESALEQSYVDDLAVERPEA